MPINPSQINCHIVTDVPVQDESLFSFANTRNIQTVKAFHNSLPGYSPTPLMSLEELSKHLGLGMLFIKDESQRFDLNAFKVLGASFAIAKFLGKELGLSDSEITFSNIIAHQEQYAQTRFVTATDGNHGRAVAWAAKLFGCRAVVYMPKGSSAARLAAIKAYDAEAFITSFNYDDTVLHAKAQAEEHNWVLMQDTAWKGYQDIPLQIMQGYSTLVTEAVEQMMGHWPSHVFVQAGVGSLAAALLACLKSFSQKSTSAQSPSVQSLGAQSSDNRVMPTFVVVEPNGAACLYESSKRKQRFRVRGDLPTIMAGLACGEPSDIAWDILNKNSHAFIRCADDIAKKGMKILGNPLHPDEKIISGESGAVCLGVLYEIMHNKEYSMIKQDLQLTAESKVLLFSTEGDTDEDLYREIVWS